MFPTWVPVQQQLLHCTHNDKIFQKLNCIFFFERAFSDNTHLQKQAARKKEREEVPIVSSPSHFPSFQPHLAFPLQWSHSHLRVLPRLWSLCKPSRGSPLIIPPAPWKLTQSVHLEGFNKSMVWSDFNPFISFFLVIVFLKDEQISLVIKFPQKLFSFSLWWLSVDYSEDEKTTSRR